MLFKVIKASTKKTTNTLAIKKGGHGGCAQNSLPFTVGIQYTLSKLEQ